MIKNSPLTGHYANQRQRFLKNGIDGFLDYEVIELLLKLADARRDQKPPAKRLITKFKSLGGVLKASQESLLKVEGVGPANIFGLLFVHAVADRYLNEKLLGEDYIKSAKDVIHYLTHHLRDKSREKFMVIYLNGQNQIIDIESLFSGTLTNSAVYSREVIKSILAKDAAAVIFVHNHPSGNTKPSKDDKNITDRLKKACNTIDVAVHDHLIIAGNSYTSFAESGLL